MPTTGTPGSLTPWRLTDHRAVPVHGGGSRAGSAAALGSAHLSGRVDALNFVHRLYRRLRHLIHEVTKFGLVGTAGLIVDLGAFNLLRYDCGGAGPLHHKPLTARAISIVLATLVTYFGNRFWTW